MRVHGPNRLDAAAAMDDDNRARYPPWVYVAECDCPRCVHESARRERLLRMTPPTDAEVA